MSKGLRDLTGPSARSKARYFMIARRDDGALAGILNHDGDVKELGMTLDWDIVSAHRIDFDRDRGRPGFKESTVADRQRAIDLVCRMADSDLPEGWDHLHVTQDLIAQAYEAGMAAEREARRHRLLVVRSRTDGRLHGVAWKGPKPPTDLGDVIGEVPIEFMQGSRGIQQAATFQAIAELGEVASEVLDAVLTAGLRTRPPDPPPAPKPAPAPARKPRAEPKKKPRTKRP